MHISSHISVHRRLERLVQSEFQVVTRQAFGRCKSGFGSAQGGFRVRISHVSGYMDYAWSLKRLQY